MNQLYGRAQQTLGADQMAQLMQLVRTTTPEQAKEQVQRLVRERGVTQQEWDETAARATAICRELGIK